MASNEPTCDICSGEGCENCLTGKKLEAFLKRKDKEEEERKKQFNKDGIRKASEFKKIQSSLNVIETGIFPLDMGIGCLGPDGRMGLRQRDSMEIIGPPGAGKTAILDQLTLTTLERFGPESVFCLFSEPPEIERMERKGIDLDHVLMRCCFDPDIDYKKNLAEQHLEAALQRAENPTTKVVIIDSIAALCTASQLFEGGGTTSHRDIDVTPVAALAKVFNNFLVQWNARNKSNSILVMTNHYKEPIDTKMGSMKNDQTLTPGGRGKEYLAWVRVMVRGRLRAADKDLKHSVEETKMADTLLGSYEIFKNKYAHADNNRVIKWALDLETGRFNNEEKLLDWASLFGSRIRDPKDPKGDKKITVSELDPAVASSGAYTFIGDTSYNGQANAIRFLEENPDIYHKLKLQMYARSKKFFQDESPDFSQLLDG